jgi:pimeloyl-ACP methyl ester carboxylesterase
MRLLLLPGMDGTGRFGPLLSALPPSLSATAVKYPRDRALGYAELLPVVEGSVPDGEPFVVVGESFSGPLAVMLAARRPPGLRGVVLCASFVKSPLPALNWCRRLIRPWIFGLQPLWLLSWVLLGRRAWGRSGRLLRAAVRSVPPFVLAARARAVLGVDATAELRECPAPVLYLRAAGDRVISPRCWRLVHSLRPDAEEAVLPGPHLILQVSPVESAAVLASFCERVLT